MSRDQDDREQAFEFRHIPVLGQEVVAGLAVTAAGHYLDATVGGGGHSRLILDAAPGVKITGAGSGYLGDRGGSENAGTFWRLSAALSNQLCQL